MEVVEHPPREQLPRAYVESTATREMEAIKASIASRYASLQDYFKDIVRFSQSIHLVNGAFAL